MYKDANITLMVSDFNRSVNFYTEVLGLTLHVRYGDEWAEVVGPGIKIGLHHSDGRENSPQLQRAKSTSIGLEVENLESAIATLASRGIEFGPIRDDDGAIREANFTDPDGLTLYIFQMNHGSHDPK
jgi:catechol 2,3-dioxygenase-like lactoylglutathione lyase family enzyme